MRPLEIVIPILLAVYLLSPQPPPDDHSAYACGGLIIMLAHFTLEGYRWQMIPLYALTLILPCFSFLYRT